jgi:hypothetical protein
MVKLTLNRSAGATRLRLVVTKDLVEFCRGEYPRPIEAWKLFRDQSVIGRMGATKSSEKTAIY